MIDDATIPTLAEGVSFREVGQQAILLRLTDGQLYSLNETGSSFVSKIDGSRGFGTIVSMLEEEYEIEPAVLRADIEELIAALKKDGLLIER